MSAPELTPTIERPAFAARRRLNRLFHSVDTAERQGPLRVDPEYSEEELDALIAALCQRAFALLAPGALERAA